MARRLLPILPILAWLPQYRAESLVYAVLDTSRQLGVGPVAMDSLPLPRGLRACT